MHLRMWLCNVCSHVCMYVCMYVICVCMVVFSYLCIVCMYICMSVVDVIWLCKRQCILYSQNVGRSGNGTAKHARCHDMHTNGPQRVAQIGT